MAHADNATKAWVSAVPKKNADGNVIEWTVRYKYTLAASGKTDFVSISILKEIIHIHLRNLKKLTHHQRHLISIPKLSC